MTPKTTATLCAALFALCAAGTAAAETLRIGTLPAADSIVLQAAADEGLFKAEGLDVEIVPFKSALEIGAAMRAGRLQGHFGDLMNVFTQNATGIGQKIVVTITHTNPEQRAFGLVTSPAAAEKLTSLEAIPAGTKTAMSSATIIDYLLDRMAETTKTEGKLENLEVKQIPIRLQMLLSNKVDTALLPEPLVSVVASKGGRVLWEDKGLNEALAVVALKNEVATEEVVASFRKAVAEAARRIEADPEKFRGVMVKKGLLPPPVAPQYTMVRFSIYQTADGLPPLPAPEEVTRVGDWMVKKGMLKAVPAYEDVVYPAAR